MGTIPQRMHDHLTSGVINTVTPIDNGQKLPVEIKVGDRIIFSKYAGTEVKIDGDEYVIFSEHGEKILAFCVEPRTREEIQVFVGIAHRERFRAKMLRPLLKSGRLRIPVIVRAGSGFERVAHEDDDGIVMRREDDLLFLQFLLILQFLQ